MSLTKLAPSDPSHRDPGSALHQWFSTGGIFAPQGTDGSVWGCCWLLLLLSRGQECTPVIHRAAPHNREPPGLKWQKSADLRNPGLNQPFTFHSPPAQVFLFTADEDVKHC